MRLELRGVSALDGDDRARFVRIYESSFPEGDRDPTMDLLDAIAAGERRCTVAVVDGRLAGLAIFYQLAGLEVEYLDYLAVDPARRSQGIGSRLLDRVVAELQPSRLGLFFEVEPLAGSAGAERALRQRRIDFYLRHGARLVDCAPGFRAPARGGPLPYTLMWRPLGDQRPRLEGDLLRRSLVALFRQAYDLDASDPLVREVLAGLAC